MTEKEVKTMTDGAPANIRPYVQVLPITYGLIVKATTTDDERQLQRIQQVHDILRCTPSQKVGNLIPDIFLNEDTQKYQYMNGNLVPGYRFEVGQDSHPVPGDDPTLHLDEQETYLHRITIPAISRMVCEQLDAEPTTTLETQSPETLRVLLEVCSWAVQFDHPETIERRNAVREHLQAIRSKCKV